ncbi:bifunctional diguanylate cyclase/phosphodiesterase [Bosea sp. (in: a-proteobacteria)]|uniref:putative bifunctional diguanylate cyclase/phosphodiesterase n=1 Tax=Bosea sp. (in: a-proteobacteria) TaxID=1871050 RepID=UPI00263A0CE2|nr:EAL domain-containing response regulator [Bosea sp. (in: a-proteobacteria)]MCO5093559.1 EAL domain-containing protein [Bosea sp. (in: a-proteobacteria)]
MSPSQKASASDIPFSVPADGRAQPATLGRILLVDDVLDNRIVLGRRLQRRGYEIVEADCGEAALDLLARERFDLVLLDVMMPGMSGLAVVTEIRKTRSSQQLPVIMVTAKSLTDDVVEALQCGADDYITKPVDFEVAQARIVLQISRKRAADTLEQCVRDRTAALSEAATVINREVEQNRQSTLRAEFLSRHDSLTKLMNRAAFLEAATDASEAHAAGGAPYDILFLDLDRFKIINDTFGHGVGDLALKSLAEKLEAIVSTKDALARFGGDEFLVLHRCGPGDERTATLAERIIRKLTEPLVVEGHEVSVGISIGVAAPAGKLEPAEITIGHADIAMYRAKKDGGDRYRLFDPELAEATRRRSELERDLRVALKCGQFNVVYQPVVELADHSISGFEALLRWNHPRRGAISPAEFIPIAEETGVIVQIGEWVLRQACATAMTWPGEAKVAVNLSAIQFERSPIVSIVMNALAASGLAPERLELEITETLILLSAPQTLEALRQLRQLGVRIVMDDFGTGYSSLSYLRDFEFDKIKVDQSFIRSLPTDEGTRAIVASISQLAQTLGVATTAEGVETEEQLEHVKTNGIGLVQGFFFGKPITAMEIEGVFDALDSHGLQTGFPVNF